MQVCTQQFNALAVTVAEFKPRVSLHYLLVPSLRRPELTHITTASYEWQLKSQTAQGWKETYLCVCVCVFPCLCKCSREECLDVVPGKMTSSLMKRPAEGLSLCGEGRISNCLPATVIAKHRTGPLYHWIFVKQPLRVADSIINLTIWTKGPTQ